MRARVHKETTGMRDNKDCGVSFAQVDTVGDAYIVAAWLAHAGDDGDASLMEALSARDWQSETCARTSGHDAGDISFGNDPGCSASAKRANDSGKKVERKPTAWYFWHQKALEAGHAQRSAHAILWLAGTMLDTVEAYTTKDGHKLSARIGISAGKLVVGALGSLQPRIHIRGDAMREAERLEQLGRPGNVHVSDVFLNILARRAVFQSSEFLACSHGADDHITNLSSIDVSLGGTGAYVFWGRGGGMPGR